MAINFPNSPTDGQIFYDSTSGNRYIYSTSKGRWSVASNNSPFVATADKQVIFNNAGSIYGNAGLVFDSSANTLTANTINAFSMRVTGNLYIGSNTVVISNNSISAQSLNVTTMIVGGTAVPTGATSNLAFDTANGAFGMANSAVTNAAAAFAHSNTTYAATNSVFGVVNAAFSQSNSEVTRLSASYVVANAAYGQANTLATSTNAYASAVGTSTNNYTSATYSTLTQFGSVFGVANGAFAKANTALQNTNGVIVNGDFGLASRLYFKTADAWTGSYALLGLSWDGAVGTYRNLGIYDYVNTRAMFTVNGQTRDTETFGIAYAYGSSRSPIFYDSDNTGYYLDAAGTSNLNGLTVAGTITGSISGVSRGVVTSDPAIGTGGLWVTSASGLNVARNGTAYIAIDAGNYTSYVMPYFGVVTNADQYVNFRVMRNAHTASINDGMYIGFGNTNSADTRIYGGGLTSSPLTKSGTFTTESGSGGMRAPIFYDSDDTGYYANPNSVSLFNRLAIKTAGADTTLKVYQYAGTSASPTEVADWPYPVLSLRSYGDFYRQTMVSFGLPGDADYQANDGNIWKIYLNGVNANGWDNNSNLTPKTSTDATVGLEILGPGNLRIGSVNSKNVYIRTNNTDKVTVDATGNMTVSGYVYAPGAVVQVQQTAKTSTTSIAVTGNSWNEFDSAFRVTITPKSSSSKILLSASITGAQNTGTVRYKFQFSTNGGSSWSDVTPIGDAVSNRSRGHFGYAVNGDTNQFNTCSMEILHSPATTSAIIYRIQFGQDVSTTYHFNRSIAYSDNFLGGTMTSTIIAKEIAV